MARRQAAEARKAEAEACAAENEVDPAKARANAEAARAVAEAAKAKIDVEVAASKARAEADAAKARADAEAARAGAGAAKARAEAFWKRIKLLAGGLMALGALYLGYDHLTHSFDPYVRWRMRCKLRQGPLEVTLPKIPAHEFPMKRPNFDSELPILVLGHTGTGKSTILGGLARDFKRRGVPVVYFKLLAWGSESIEGRSDTQTFSSAATAVFEAIGYPQRPSLLSRLSILRGGFGHTGVNAEVGVEDAREAVAHFQHAVSDLFSVCRELYEERGHCSEVDRAPVILVDELHDLMHSDRLRRLGGETIFRLMASELVSNCTDAKRVRFCSAASSSLLLHELADTAARGNRTTVFTAFDPPAEAVLQRLCAIGFSEASAELILSTCGTRLRILSPFLNSSNAGSMDVALELKQIVSMARGDIERLFALVQEDAAAKRELGLLLDKLCAAEGGGSVHLCELPKLLKSMTLASTSSGTVYLNGNCVEIQSQPCCVAWREMRMGYFRET